jgi:hypothetical protein
MHRLEEWSPNAAGASLRQAQNPAYRSACAFSCTHFWGKEIALLQEGSASRLQELAGDSSLEKYFSYEIMRCRFRFGGTKTAPGACSRA